MISVGRSSTVLIGLAVFSGLAYHLVSRTNPPTRQTPSMSQTAPASATADGSNTSINNEFANPELVVIQGYSGNAEEPYLTPDGQYLVFDDRTGFVANEHPRIYCGKRVNDTTFAF